MGAEYNYNEVIVCRFIGILLKLKGRHGFGCKPMKHFICDVLKDEELENAVITLEEHTNNDRRMKILLKDPQPPLWQLRIFVRHTPLFNSQCSLFVLYCCEKPPKVTTKAVLANYRKRLCYAEV